MAYQPRQTEQQQQERADQRVREQIARVPHAPPPTVYVPDGAVRVPVPAQKRP